jgi:hypothetical protein
MTYLTTIVDDINRIIEHQIYQQPFVIGTERTIATRPIVRIFL